MKAMYRIDEKWFTKDNPDGSVDKVSIGGKTLRIGSKKELWRGKVYIQGEFPKDQRLLKMLHGMGKPYIIEQEIPAEAQDKVKKVLSKASNPNKVEIKVDKPKKSKVKDEPKDINEEGKEVSAEEKED
tara:strand:+ start:487 stop:870 length:384 start_codon:yes stop_codon:yes gene_type:complete